MTSAPATDAAMTTGMSTNDYTATLEQRRYSHQAKGLVLLMPRTGLIVVPFQQHRNGWDVVVIGGSDTYRPDGYSLSVGDREIETAIQLYTEARIHSDARGRMVREGFILAD